MSDHITDQYWAINRAICAGITISLRKEGRSFKISGWFSNLAGYDRALTSRTVLRPSLMASAIDAIVQEVLDAKVPTH